MYLSLLATFPKELPLEGLWRGADGLTEGVVSAHMGKRQKHPNCRGVTGTTLLWGETVNKIRLHPCQVVSSGFPSLVNGGVGSNARDLGCSAGAASM